MVSHGSLTESDNPEKMVQGQSDNSSPFFLLLWKPEWICNMLVGIEGKIGGNARSSGAHRSPETAASRSGLGVLACAHQYTQSETTVHGSPPRLQLPPPRLSLLLHFRKVCYSGARSGKDFCHLSILPFSPFQSASRMINIGHRRCQGHR